MLSLSAASNILKIENSSNIRLPMDRKAFFTVFSPDPRHTLENTPINDRPEFGADVSGLH